MCSKAGQQQCAVNAVPFQLSPWCCPLANVLGWAPLSPAMVARCLPLCPVVLGQIKIIIPLFTENEVLFVEGNIAAQVQLSG